MDKLLQQDSYLHWEASQSSCRA